MMYCRISLLLIVTCVSQACSSANKIVANPIPALNTKGDVYKTEGDNDQLIYGSAVGRKKCIMLYVDFAHAEMTIGTKERGQGVLGKGKFEQLFKEQSYGKLSFDIEHVHGWRRLSKSVRTYSSRTTDSHRALFVEIFSLYPKVDFRKYDYIMANMPRIGNTAFGERSAIAIPYKGGKIKVALNISSGSPNVLAHETAHLMGLPDLYTLGGVPGPKNPVGPWDIMSDATGATGFLGWHRHKLNWLDADRKTYVSKKGTHKLQLTSLAAASGCSMIVVPVDDPASPSKVFVIEVAQSIRLKRDTYSKAEGVLIYSVDASIETGRNPVIVYPRTEIREAAFHAGDRFEHEESPMAVRVLERTESGAYRLEIVVK